MTIAEFETNSSGVESNKENAIYIYDTYRKPAFRKKKNEIKYPLSFVQDACELMQESHNFVRFSVRDIPQTNKKENAGFLAIIYAYILSRKEDPLSFVINEENIRESLICFLETKEFLPNTIQRNQSVLRDSEYATWHEYLYCHCNKPDFGNRMMCCDRCKIWFHEKCEDFSDPNQITVVGDIEEWRCRYCIGIHILPDEVIRKIFFLMCLEEEVSHSRLSLVCKKWSEIIDINFRDAVHIAWLDQEFQSNKWSPRRKTDYRKGFDIFTRGSILSRKSANDVIFHFNSQKSPKVNMG